VERYVEIDFKKVVYENKVVLKKKITKTKKDMH